jgi:hypothetical protein
MVCSYMAGGVLITARGRGGKFCCKWAALAAKRRWGAPGMGIPAACKFPVFAGRAGIALRDEQKWRLAANPLQKQQTAGQAVAVAVL